MSVESIVVVVRRLLIVIREDVALIDSLLTKELVYLTEMLGKMSGSWGRCGQTKRKRQRQLQNLFPGPVECALHPVAPSLQQGACRRASEYGWRRWVAKLASRPQVKLAEVEVVRDRATWSDRSLRSPET